MRTWRAAFTYAIRANPKLSATFAIEAGLLLYAAFKARHGRSASVPPAEAIIEAVPAIAAAAVAAPALTPKRKRR
jgi:hypothetical protein